MYLRLSRYAGLPAERIDQMIRDFERGEYVRGLEESPGFAGYMLGVDWNGGKATAVSLWETRDNLEASDRQAERARTERTERAQPSREPIVDRYEVVFRREPASG